MASAVYKVQVRQQGAYRGCVPFVKVQGKYHNPKAIYVKVAGIWRMTYEQFYWSYHWATGAWSGCACVGWCSSRTVWCNYFPEGLVMPDSYCSDQGPKPPTHQYCNCACACCCC